MEDESGHLTLKIARMRVSKEMSDCARMSAEDGRYFPVAALSATVALNVESRRRELQRNCIGSSLKGLSMLERFIRLSESKSVVGAKSLFIVQLRR